MAILPEKMRDSFFGELGEARHMADYKRVYRSRTDRRLAGVCGGIGKYFEVDPTPVRVVWAVTCFIGLGVLMYLLAWIIIPEEP